MSKKFEAKLVRGQTYVLEAKTWHRGTTHEVDADTKKHLEDSAIDRLTLNGPDGKEVSIRCKFVFKPVDVKDEVEETDKFDDLLSMQNDGGVGFEDDDSDNETDDDADEETEDGEDADEAPKKQKRSNPTRAKTTRRKRK